jgi:P-type Mg2+ transporter
MARRERARHLGPVSDQLPAAPGGLSEDEAARRLEREGPNALGRGGRAWTAVLAAQVRSPLLALLAGAAAVSIGVGEVVNGAIILAIMGLSVGLGFVNEFQGERALDALRARTGRRATVVRDGLPREVAAAELVTGDLCLLQIGDVVPADLRLVAAAELTIDESTLTGEAYPAEKRVDDGSGDEADGGPRPSGAFAGTVVRSGSGRGIVEATGARTRMGGVADRLGERQPPTAFQRGLTSFAGLLAWVTGILATLIFVLNGLLGRPVLDSLLFSLAIAVGLTPQLLPAIVSVSLSTGARRMARRSVLVKRLVSIEDLGDADVLFTDKTGTLTRGEITLLDAVGPAGDPAPHLAELGLVCSELTGVEGDHPLGGALDLALWRGFEPAVAREYLRASPRLATIPFTFERRRVSVIVPDPAGRRRLLCKGAAEEVIARCATARLPGGASSIEAVRDRTQGTLDRLLEAGHRTLALAERPVPDEGREDEAAERGLELLGFLVFTDPPKEDAAAAIARLRGLGVQVKVLTGDHERTAARVCAQVGLEVDGMVRGDDLARLDEDALVHAVAGASVFARVSPEQKAEIVAAEQRAGHDVAFLGDGVNDAPALHRADVGLSRSTPRSTWPARRPTSSCSRRASA